MFQATGETWLKEASQHWFERTLEMRRPGKGIAGFLNFTLGDTGEESWESEPGVLTGAAGIALALLAAATDIEPSWDRMLLVSIPCASSLSSL